MINVYVQVITYFFFKKYLFIYLFGCIRFYLWHEGLVAPWLVGSSFHNQGLGDRTHDPCIGRWILTTGPPGKSHHSISCKTTILMCQIFFH